MYDEEEGERTGEEEEGGETPTSGLEEPGPHSPPTPAWNYSVVTKLKQKKVKSRIWPNGIKQESQGLWEEKPGSGADQMKFSFLFHDNYCSK